MRRLLLVLPLALACDRVRPPAKVERPAAPAPVVVAVRDTQAPVVATPAPDTNVMLAGAPMDSVAAAPVDSTVASGAAAPDSATPAMRPPELMPPARLPALGAAPENEPMEFDDENSPVLPYVQHGECESESCERTIVAYSCMATTLHAEPDEDAAVVARIPAGEFVQARRDLVLSTAGIVVVKQDFRLDWDEGRTDIIPRADTVDFADGDTVWVLRAQERGRWTWAYQGRLHDSGEFWATTGRSGSKRMESDYAVRRSAPTREQWWQVARLDGTTGWWLQSVSGAKAREEQHDELQSVTRMQRERDDCAKVKARRKR